MNLRSTYAARPRACGDDARDQRRPLGRLPAWSRAHVGGGGRTHGRAAAACGPRTEVRFPVQTSPVWTAAIAALMIGAAGYGSLVSARTQNQRLAELGAQHWHVVPGWHAVGAIRRWRGDLSDPWYTPQYVLPLLGMVLGNSLTGIALTLDAVTSNVAAQRGARSKRGCRLEPRGSRRWTGCCGGR